VYLFDRLFGYGFYNLAKEFIAPLIGRSRNS